MELMLYYWLFLFACVFVPKSYFMSKPIEKCEESKHSTPMQCGIMFQIHLPLGQPKQFVQKATLLFSQPRGGQQNTTQAFSEENETQKKKNLDFPNIRSKHIAFSLACRYMWVVIVV